MSPITGTKPIESVVNTHGNGDHCYGNQLLADSATIYSAAAALETMNEAPPALLSAIKQAPLEPPLADFVQHAFGPFDFEGVELKLPDETFTGSLSLTIGGRAIEVIEVGPAHTAGDAIVHVPDARTVFTGDVLFIGSTPIMWAGPLENWFAACDRLCAMDVDTLVPGHGPITDKSGAEQVKAYLEFVREEATRRHAAGMDAREAAHDIELGAYADWGDPERIVVNVDSIYRELDRAHPQASPVELFEGMARWRAGKLPLP